MMQRLSVTMKLSEGKMLKGWNKWLLPTFISCELMAETRLIDRITRKQTRIGVLVQEKFALQLLYQRNSHYLQRSREDIGLLEYNRDRFYEQYEKWKNKTRAERQNILNLQGQIFALQNNLPHIGMAGYTPKRFSGRADEDIDEVIKDYRLYLTVANITTANAGGKQRALKLFRSCLTDEASR